ncbi:MAG: hypothetical protein DMF81_02380 [Acidobacteria bacterium]|nr:MAG: hypothetical protein DMF81_02380 [Acidobacteriota bacterium]
MIAYVSQSAFWGLLISAVEVYKRECFGLLIGYRDRKGPDHRYIIEHAVPYQSAGRRHRTVVNNPRAHRRIERFLQSIPQMSVIGDFHSHTMWGYSRAASSLSDTDLQGMSERQRSAARSALELQRRRLAVGHDRRPPLPAHRLYRDRRA